MKKYNNKKAVYRKGKENMGKTVFWKNNIILSSNSKIP